MNDSARKTGFIKLSVISDVGTCMGVGVIEGASSWSGASLWGGVSSWSGTYRLESAPEQEVTEATQLAHVEGVG